MTTELVSVIYPTGAPVYAEVYLERVCPTGCAYVRYRILNLDKDPLYTSVIHKLYPGGSVELTGLPPQLVPLDPGYLEG